jgi:hypothetical protein
LAVGASCGAGEKVPPPPNLHRSDLARVALDRQAVGEGWDPQPDPAPNTVQIGGRVGVGNVRPLKAEATTAYKQKEGTGFISDTVLLLRSEAAARAVVAAHQSSASRTTWTQDRDDGGRTAFTRQGTISGLPPLGDEMFAARLKVEITGAEGNPEQRDEHTIDYVVYSLGPLVAFVVTQDVAASPLARRLESRVAKLLTSK